MLGIRNNPNKMFNAAFWLGRISCAVGLSIAAVCSVAQAEWNFVGLLASYKGTPNFDRCEYRVEVQYPSVPGEFGSDSVVLTNRYKYRYSREGGWLDLLSGPAPEHMTNHLSIGGLFAEEKFNNSDELIGNHNLRSETFEIRFHTNEKGQRDPNEAGIRFDNPKTGERDYVEVKAKSVRLFESCSGQK